MSTNNNSTTKVVKKKKRNPRITVCYTPEEYSQILEEAKKAGIKKSQYIHDGSLGLPLYQLMSDEQTKALLSLSGVRSELIHIHNALNKKSQEERIAFFHDEEFMTAWVEATTYLIQRMGDILKFFTKLQGHDR